jgi:urease subunit gamma/beta
VHLTPSENDRLAVFLAASLAREALRRGLRLSLPEAIAVVADEVHWAARSGATYAQAEQAGAVALREADLLDGVAAMLDEIRVEPLFEEGTRLVVVRWPAGRPASGPGELSTGSAPLPVVPGPRLTLEVVNRSTRVVRVSSHHPMHLVNPRLDFDRSAARGWRLDLPAGGLLRWGPGESRTVRLVRDPRAAQDSR